MSNQHDNPTSSTTGSTSLAETANKLNTLLDNRPDKAELQDKNIIYASNAAPALQAAEKELARKQVENNLAQALKKRPDVDELVQEGIIRPE